MATRTVKQKILDMVGRLPDDADYERVIEGIHVLRGIEIGLAQAARNELAKRDDVLKDLLGEDAEVPPHPLFPA